MVVAFGHSMVVWCENVMSCALQNLRMRLQDFKLLLMQRTKHVCQCSERVLLLPAHCSDDARSYGVVPTTMP